jgi:hypothetical protein
MKERGLVKMLKNSYDTTTGSLFEMGRVIRGIKEDSIRGHLSTVSELLPDSPKVMKKVRVLVDTESKTPAFYHPIKVDDNIVIDGRTYLAGRGPDSTIRVKDEGGLKLLALRAALELIYSDDDYSPLYRVSDVPMFVFVSWFAENISGRLGLDPDSQLKVTVAAAYYYYSIHTKDAAWNDELRVKVASRLANITKIPVANSLEIARDLNYIDDLENFVGRIKTLTGSTRLADLNVGTLITMLSSTAGWHGVQAKETVAIGLEHPPTWHALMYTAINEKNYTRTRLSKQVQRYRGRGSSEDYVRALLHQLSDHE